MQFTLKSLGSDYQSADCYFQIRTEQHTFYSPFYSDTKAALEAMRNFVLRLRNRKSTRIAIRPDGDVYRLDLFGKKSTVAAPGTPLVDKMEAISVFDELLAAAPAAQFPLVYMELADVLEEVTQVQDLDLRVGDGAYDWQPVKETVLIVEEVKPRRAGMGRMLGASVGVSPLGGVGGPCQPIFNLLQPQLETDLPFFLGRKREVEDLFALTRNNDLLLLYGPARVGKTSLIQCGLANRMKAQPGELIVQACQPGTTHKSLTDKIRTELAKIKEASVPDSDDPKTLLPELQTHLKKPVFLVFDQLERLFDNEVEESERSSFFKLVNDLLTDENLPCRIILSLREGFLAPLADYESQLPSLLLHRYRVQRLSRRSMVNLSINLFDILGGRNQLQVDQPELIADRICSDLANEDGDVPFQCLQVYLHQLHQQGCAQSGGNTPLLDSNLIDEMGSGRSVIDNYITQRLSALEAGLPKDGEPVDPAVLEEMELLKESREHCGCGPAKTIVPVAAAAGAGAAAVRSQRLRRILWVALGALFFGSITYWILSGWTKRQDPCYLAVKADTCEGFINYLSQHGDDGVCAEEFRALLAERQCAVWTDYQMIKQNPTCGTYQDFFAKYRNTAVSTEQVQRRLIEWACPLVRDTVEVEVRDTLYRETPVTFGLDGRRITSVTPSGKTPPCQEFSGRNFKKVGPLWLMTDPLPGGTLSWEEALAACNKKGWRLPCIGEVDFLIENMYRGEPARAYSMLTGSGACYLINPEEEPNRRIDFWTGTEADDATAWTFYFDTEDQIIGRDSDIKKERRLPCMCVKKDRNNLTTGLPPCYNKTVDRQ